MEDEDACMASVREERYDSNGNLLVSGVDEDKACITVIDLSTLDPYAVGFNRGFVGTSFYYYSIVLEVIRYVGPWGALFVCLFVCLLVCIL